MRCCLINPLWGSRGSIRCAPPLGLAYIASVLEENGHEVKIVDRVAIYYRDPELDMETLDNLTKEELLEFEPQIIGLSATTAQVQDMKHIAKLIRRIKSLSSCTIVVGGFHPSAEPELTLNECPEIDLLCCGEGEFTMLDIVSGKDPSNISGLMFRNNGGISATPSRPILNDIDALPLPGRHLLDMQFYHRNDSKVAFTTLPALPLSNSTILTTRGCPYNCYFCGSRLIYKKIRWHSPMRVIKEVDYITENYRVDSIWFCDDMFLSNRKRVMCICDELLKRKKKLRWACSVQVRSVDEDILRLMKEAGCIYIVYGLESGSQRALDLMNKKATVDQNRKAVELANKVGILVNSAFIVNIPEETEEDFILTRDFIKSTDIYCATLNRLMLLPGSPFYERLHGEGQLKRSENIWSEIGAISHSSEELTYFSNIPKTRFLELFKETSELIDRKNQLNYVRVNWFRDPFRCMEYVVYIVANKILAKETKLYRIAKYLYGVIKRTN